jgi:exopolyphosphatase/guanosine-5'-triphosphate,3'-diphosphate pyrophosphatase
VRCACIDIGSNTTRLLVADRATGFPREVEQQRAFTHVRRGLRSDGTLDAEKLVDLVDVVGAQVARARELGARHVVVVATAAVRRARNAPELGAALERRCGVTLKVLSETEEARLAFIGACGALAKASASAADSVDGDLGVVDVGGGSSEVIVGTTPDAVRWSASLPLGSGDLADGWFRSDPPAAGELEAARGEVLDALAPIRMPMPMRAVAVGGSAASLCRMAGQPLAPAVFAGALSLLLGRPAPELAARFNLDVERVRLLPAGLLILQAVQERLGVPLEFVGGGLREGVLMELAHV